MQHTDTHGSITVQPAVETVWKIRTGSTSGFQKSVKRGEKRPYYLFAGPKICNPEPPAIYQTVSIRVLLGNRASGILTSRKSSFRGLKFSESRSASVL